MISVYVAGSFVEVERVRAAHVELERLGLRPTSTWVAHATGEPEALEHMQPEALQAIIEENDAQVRKADVVLVLASLAGKETYCEARYACELGRLVLWVGEPRPLTAYRKTVRWCPNVEVALAFLAGAYASSSRRVGRPLF